MLWMTLKARKLNVLQGCGGRQLQLKKRKRIPVYENKSTYAVSNFSLLLFSTFLTFPFGSVVPKEGVDSGEYFQLCFTNFYFTIHDHPRQKENVQASRSPLLLVFLVSLFL